MRFFQITSALALATAANAAMSASTMQSNIDQITELSSDTNEIAESLSVTNIFQKAPQVINNFKSIIETATNDNSAMDSKRSLEARQECLDVTDVEQCIEDISEIVEDPSEILGRKKKRQNPGYSDADQQGICSAFRVFVQVNEKLLKTLIGKHSLLSPTPFTQPVAAILRTLEYAIDTLAFGIIDVVPTSCQDATQNKNSLDAILRDAQDTYNMDF